MKKAVFLRDGFQVIPLQSEVVGSASSQLNIVLNRNADGVTEKTDAIGSGVIKETNPARREPTPHPYPAQDTVGDTVGTPCLATHSPLGHAY